MTGAVKTAVKELAEFVHRSGDLHLGGQSTTLAQEGIAAQRRWQENRGESYRREHRVSAVFGVLEVTGRIDGWDPAALLVEEVKTTRTDVATVHGHAGAQHLAQLRLYGALLALGGAEAEDGAGADAETGGAGACERELNLRLVYLHPQDAVPPRAFDERWNAADLVAYFEATCGQYVAWLDAVSLRLAARGDELRRLRFPYACFHPHQRRIAKHVYRGFRDAADWLVEAPTGAGKTMACLFPALKAMGEGALDRMVFLTSRTTGQQAVEDALAALAADALSTVTVTAKERICFNPGTPCDAALCQFARGYHDRAPAARRALLSRGRCGREDVEQVARRFEVCPFELSLEAAAWADVVVCDYNYVFDPLVRLKRLTAAPLPGPRAGLVIDEAHQLGERVRDMLGAKLERGVVRAALREPALAAALRPGLRAIDRALGALAASLPKAATTTPVAASEVAEPKALRRAVDRVLAVLPTLAAETTAAAAVNDAAWQLLGLQRAMERAGERMGTGEDESAAEGGAATATAPAFHYLATSEGRDCSVEVVCTLPAEHIRATMAPFHGTVRLSGTLTPPRVYQRLHGFDDGPNVLRAASDPADDRLAVFVVPDVPTYYRARQASLPALATLIAEVGAATPGNCLVAFPSFEYLGAAAELLAGMSSRAADAQWRRQQPGMDLAARADFIAWLNEPNARRIGLAVAGGVFAESVDFDGDALRAVVAVGVGLPPRSLQRDLIAQDTALDGADGDEIAYRQPAMVRVAQAVGRIARGGRPGVAVLVDPRFANAAYRAFFPTRWRPQTMPAKAASAAVRAFWSSRTPRPRADAAAAKGTLAPPVRRA